MKIFNQKKNIFIIIVSIIVIVLIIYYAFMKDEQEIFEYEEAENMQNIENIASSEVEETQKETITIYITGAVNSPGVYTLPEGMRITDAVNEAQGLKEDADVEEINLAEVMTDGMHIQIPTKGQIDEAVTAVETTSKKSGKVNINTASQEELENLSGIGPSTAEKIIKYRTEIGKFKAIEDLKEISGIGEGKFNKIKDMICVK